MQIKLQKQKLLVNRRLLLLVVVFVLTGLVAIGDVSTPQALSQYSDKFFFLKQQLMWSMVGIVGFIFASKIHFSLWKKIATPMFLFGVLLLIVVLTPYFGFSALGARRWLVVGPFNFQPSEFIKLILVIFLAKVADKNKTPISYFLPLSLVFGLIMLQPDLGTTLVVAIIGFSQIFVSQVSFWYFAGFGALGVLGTLGLILTSSYRRDRLTTFFEMTSDPLGKSYHIRQILLGLGSGGWFGLGLGASRQKYSFLPEASTDSIFAVIAEETGFVGAVVVVALFVYFMLIGMSIAKRAPDTFSKVLAIGITAWICGQAFLNIASMVALVPLTGIPLPFFSYGGSALVTVLFACGILLNISKYGTIEKRI